MKLLASISVILLLASCNGKRQDTEVIQTTPEDFHIYLLMGQSNMSGRAPVEAEDTIRHPRVVMLTKDLNWVLATSPMHFDRPPGMAGTGPGLSFGKYMAALDSSVTIGLVPCAKGSSSIKHWKNGVFHKSTLSYPYTEAVTSAKAAMQQGVIKGIIWHQGESDCVSEERISQYKDEFLAFRDSLFKDLGIHPVPMVVGELGHFFYPKNEFAEMLNEKLNELAGENAGISLASAEGLEEMGDALHFSAQAYRELGERYAWQMVELQDLMEKK